MNEEKKTRILHLFGRYITLSGISIMVGEKKEDVRKLIENEVLKDFHSLFRG